MLLNVTMEKRDLNIITIFSCLQFQPCSFKTEMKLTILRTHTCPACVSLRCTTSYCVVVFVRKTVALLETVSSRWEKGYCYMQTSYHLMHYSYPEMQYEIIICIVELNNNNCLCISATASFNRIWLPRKLVLAQR